MAHLKEPSSRIKPLDEGTLREIKALLISPFRKFKPIDFTDADWLRHLFCVDDRKIIEYVVTSSFELKGALRVAASKTVRGIYSPVLNEGAVMWVRMDRKMPNRIDVEVNHKWLTLDPHEWTAAVIHLKKI